MLNSLTKGFFITTLIFFSCNNTPKELNQKEEQTESVETDTIVFSDFHLTTEKAIEFLKTI